MNPGLTEAVRSWSPQSSRFCLEKTVHGLIHLDAESHDPLVPIYFKCQLAMEQAAAAALRPESFRGGAGARRGGRRRRE